ncbi:transglutaminase domain-containing protein [Paenibacillus lemnae]|uniref:Transglutaminase domain-containing protein n=1 Tax=Paenibacillus lemnae TaxID=1330551 RepID=A0A848M3M8_PAELE|nr:transglutaminase domain-containing protein [Paenibacillus lemnae]NMO94443.1 transglutaminase domain-containing protein [Paenibacillus lemnae]
MSKDMKEQMSQLDAKFEEKRHMAGPREHDLFHIFDQDLTEEEVRALKYLYAYMPVNDMADYDGELFLNHVRQTLDIRRRVPWGQRVPDELFLHFVLPYRVNTENIEDVRGLMYSELAERTAKLSMQDAILETNYWCHEKATYIGSDLRTMSPLTIMRTARGRCGEESTLAVSALRSIGIPARQIYTPRWAHCDDNHAWVEAWADGEWYFIGACEPEARLNQGWFGPPARRAMLINTRIFGDYPGPENITLADPWFTEINVLENYARTRTIEVTVKDDLGRPVTGAEVRFELYNMAELYPIAILPTDERGEASFKTGLGDLVIRAVKDGVWHEVKNTPDDAGQVVELILDTREQPVGTEDLDLVPPPEREGEPVPDLTDAQIRRHNERLEEGTGIRNAFEATFPGRGTAADIARTAGLPEDRVWDVIRKARGNGHEIAAFLQQYAEAYGEWPLRLLESLNEKDLADTFIPVLENHLTGALRYREETSEEMFTNYILCPRVLQEMIVPYRREIREAFTSEEAEGFRADPQKLAQVLEQDYTFREDIPNLKGRGNPLGTFRMKAGDEMSLGILFVAAARSLGIPARLHPSEQKPQYAKGSRWMDAMFANAFKHKEQPGEWGRLQLLRDPAAGPDTPEASYEQTFTFARLENGAYKTLVYPHGKTDVYDEPFEVEPGAYRITSGVRLKDGSVYVRFIYVTVRAGELCEVMLTFRDVQEGIPVLGTIDRSSVLTTLDGSDVGLGELLGTKGALAAWLEPEREPSKHLLRELGELAEYVEQQGIPVILLIGHKEWTSSFSPVQYPKLPKDTVFVKDDSYAALPNFIPNSAASEAGYPHLFVIDAQDEIRYTASGYKIGMGKEALQTFIQLNS